MVFEFEQSFELWLFCRFWSRLAFRSEELFVRTCESFDESHESNCPHSKHAYEHLPFSQFAQCVTWRIW